MSVRRRALIASFVGSLIVLGAYSDAMSPPPVSNDE